MPDPSFAKVPWLDERAIRAEADRLLAESHPAGNLPVPVELIVERLGIDIVPVPGLRKLFDIDGVTSLDMRCIYVDQWLSENRENRYRFTLAHELGHVRLHTELFREIRLPLPPRSGGQDFPPREWLDFHESLNDASGGSLEWQANRFAGFFLVPAQALRVEFEKSLPQVRRLVAEAEAARRGIPRNQVLDMAWDELAQRVALPFGVSKDVILRRLATDEFSPADL